MRVEITVHQSCVSSRRLFRALLEHRLLGQVSFVDSSANPEKAIREGAISVPWVSLRGKGILTDPIDPGDVVQLIRGGRGGPLTLDQAISNFAAGVAASLVAVGTTMVHESFAPLSGGDFAQVTSKMRWGRPSFSAKELREALAGEEGRRLLDENRDHYVRSLAYNLARHAYWAGLPLRSAKKEVVGTWLLAAAGTGRVGLPYPVNVGNLAEEVVAVLEAKADDYENRLVQEREELSADKDFASLFGNAWSQSGRREARALEQRMPEDAVPPSGVGTHHLRPSRPIGALLSRT